MTAGRPILVARIGAAHGVRGEVRVKSFTADPMALGEYRSFMVDPGRTLEVERLREGKDVVVVKFRGVDDRDAAEALNGTELFIDRAFLPMAGEDEFYHADLIGLTACDEAGAPFGSVIAVHDFGAGDILEIAPSSGASLLIPFTKAAVPVIDIDGGRITVTAPAAPEEDEQTTGPGELSR